MNEQAFAELVDRACAEVEHSPAPLGEIVREAHRRSRRRRATVVVLGGAATGVALSTGAILMNQDDPGRAQVTDTTSAPPSVTPSDLASTPPRPAPITMQTVRRFGQAQEFRPYSGPIPPPISEAQALSRSRLLDDYSLGLWDVGMVHDDGSVDWTPAWIIAGEYYVEDVSPGSLGGRGPDPTKAQPGWIRDVVMYDVRTGRDFLGYSF